MYSQAFCTRITEMPIFAPDLNSTTLRNRINGPEARIGFFGMAAWLCHTHRCIHCYATTGKLVERSVDNDYDKGAAYLCRDCRQLYITRCARSDVHEPLMASFVERHGSMEEMELNYPGQRIGNVPRSVAHLPPRPIDDGESKICQAAEDNEARRKLGPARFTIYECICAEEPEGEHGTGYHPDHGRDEGSFGGSYGGKGGGQDRSKGPRQGNQRQQGSRGSSFRSSRGRHGRKRGGGDSHDVDGNTSSDDASLVLESGGEQVTITEEELGRMLSSPGRV